MAACGWFALLPTALLADSSYIYDSDLVINGTVTTTGGATIPTPNDDGPYLFAMGDPRTVSGNGTWNIVGHMALRYERYYVTFAMTGGTINITDGAHFCMGGWGGLHGTIRYRDWTNNKSSMTVNGTLNLWDTGCEVRVDSLNGHGSIIQGGGDSSDLYVGVNNGSGTFSGTFGGTNGYVSLVKNGSGTQAFTRTSGSKFRNITVNEGTLSIASTLYQTGDAEINIASGATFQISTGVAVDSVHSPDASLASTGGAFKLSGAGTFEVTSGQVELIGSHDIHVFLNGNGKKSELAMSEGGWIQIDSGAAFRFGGWDVDVRTSNNLGSLRVNGKGILWDTATTHFDKLEGTGEIYVGNDSAGQSVLCLGTANGSATFAGTMRDHRPESTAAGTISLQKIGTGTQTMTGDISIKQVSIEGGTLQIGNGGTTGTLVTTDGISVSSGAVLKFNRTDHYTISNNAFTGTGTLEKVGSGTAEFTGINANSGNTSWENSLGAVNVREGMLIINPYSATPDAEIITGGSGVGNYFGAATTTVYSGATLRYAKRWTGPARDSLVINGGTVQVAQYNYLGNVTFGGNALIEEVTVAGDGTATNSTTGYTRVGYTHAPNWTVNGTGNQVTAPIVMIRSGDNTRFNINTTADSELTVSSISDYPNDMYRGMELYKTGAGKMTITGNSAYEGLTTVHQGTLQIGSNGTTGTFGTGTVTVDSGAVLALNRSNTLTIDNAFAGSGTLEQIGSGTTIFTGVNTNEGSTNWANSLGAVNVRSGLMIINPYSENPAADIISAIGVGNYFGAATTSVYSGATLRYMKRWTAPSQATLVVDGGTVQVAQYNYFGNVTLSNGALLEEVAVAGDGSTSNTTVGYLRVGYTNNPVWTVTGTGNRVTAPIAMVRSGDNNCFTIDTAANSDLTVLTIKDTAAAYEGMTLNKTGAGTLILNGTSTYTGLTSVAGGVLQVGTGSTTGTFSTGDITVASGAVVKINRSNELTVTNTFTGAGTLEQIGTGTTVFTGDATRQVSADVNLWANNISAVYVRSGVMVINPDSDGPDIAAGNYFGADSITVSSGATLRYERRWTAPTQDQLIIDGGTVQSGNFNYFGLVTLGNGALLEQVNDASREYVRVGFAIDPVWTVTGTGNRVTAPIAMVRDGDSDCFTINTAADSDLTVSTIKDNTTYPGMNLNKAGAGLLTITGDSTYIGTTTISGGTLQIGNGGTVGTLGTGDVTIESGANLKFNRSNALTVSNAISGAGSVEKLGAGTTTLTGTNTYTGTTTISAGILQVGDGSTSGTLGNGGEVTMASGTTLKLNRSDALTVSNSITGAGSLEKLGAGTTTLTGTNAYTGATTISGGTLQIGDGGTSGTLGNSGAVTVASGATLKFNRSDDLTVNNAISGAGNLEKVGENTVILTGANTYTGSTTISAGTLQIGTNSTAGAIGTGTLQIDGTLTLQNLASGQLTLSNQITGSGSIVKRGSQRVVLNGTGSTFDSGEVIVNGGTLVVQTNLGENSTGYINGCTLEVGTNGVLGSTTVDTGNVLVNGGTLAGDLTVNDTDYTSEISSGTITGDVLLNSGSAFDATGGTIDGDVTINSGATMNVSGGDFALVENNGNLTLTGGDIDTLTMNDGSQTQITLSDPNAGYYVDELFLNDGAALVINMNGNLGQSQDYLLFAANTDMGGTAIESGNSFSSVTVHSKQGTIVYTGENVHQWITVDESARTIVLHYNPDMVPEPSTWLLLALGCGAIGWMTRRNRRKCPTRVA